MSLRSGMNQSLLYRSPGLYRFLLWAAHGAHLAKRYRAGAKSLGEAKTVFEPLCGPAILPSYLPDCVEYSGFDINERFVRYARRKGRNVWQGDAREEAPYRHGLADGVAIVYSLHHVQPYEAQQRVVERAARAARSRLVICEPFGDRLLGLLDKAPFLKKPAEWLFDWAERDGTNQSCFEHVLTRESLKKRMDDGYGVLNGVRHSIRQIGPDDLIVAYYL